MCLSIVRDVRVRKIPSVERMLIFPSACAAARFRCFFCHHCKVMQKRSLTINNNHARTKKPGQTKNIYKRFSILFNRLNIFDMKMAGQRSVFMYFESVKCSLNHSFQIVVHSFHFFFSLEVVNFIWTLTRIPFSCVILVHI